MRFIDYKIVLKYTSVSRVLLYSYQKFLKILFLKYRINFFFINNSPKIKYLTLLKSPHVNKKSKENFKYIINSFKLYMFANIKILKLLKINTPKNIYSKIIFFC
jgi:hypothetical protein